MDYNTSYQTMAFHPACPANRGDEPAMTVAYINPDQFSTLPEEVAEQIEADERGYLDVMGGKDGNVTKQSVEWAAERIANNFKIPVTVTLYDADGWTSDSIVIKPRGA